MPDSSARRGKDLNCAWSRDLLRAPSTQVLALIRILSLILLMVPDGIKLAVVVGMGLLLSFIGLQVGASQGATEEHSMTRTGPARLWLITAQ